MPLIGRNSFLWFAKNDDKSILVDFILAVGHICWIIGICTIFFTHQLSGCIMKELAITEFNSTCFIIASRPHSHV